MERDELALRILIAAASGALGKQKVGSDDGVLQVRNRDKGPQRPRLTGKTAQVSERMWGEPATPERGTKPWTKGAAGELLKA
jgi:hypothetical protein